MLGFRTLARLAGAAEVRGACAETPCAGYALIKPYLWLHGG